MMIKQTVCPNCGGLLQSESHGWICKKCKGFISLVDGKFYEYVEKPFVPPMTNADRIRAMSDKEIAKLLVDATSIGCPFKMDWSCEKEKDGWDACDACWCKWLKQPAE